MEEINNEEVEDDISKYAKLESVALSEGGILLVDGLKSDISDCTDRIIVGYKKLPHIELIAIIAQLEAKFNMYKAIARAGNNKKLAKDALELILTEI